MKDHLLGRLLKIDYDGDERDFTDEERNTVIVEHHRLYTHKVFRINHTTYDVWRNQDSVNPKSHCDIMLLSHEEENLEGRGDRESSKKNKHPFWYARVLGVYHASVCHMGPASRSEAPQKIDFLWIRFFGAVADNIPSGWEARRLHLVGFVPETDPYAFGFIDPNEVIRGIHLIPAFHHGRTSSLLGPSVARNREDKDEDWQFYYVGRYAP